MRCHGCLDIYFLLLSLPCVGFVWTGTSALQPDSWSYSERVVTTVHHVTSDVWRSNRFNGIKTNFCYHSGDLVLVACHVYCVIIIKYSHIPVMRRVQKAALNSYAFIFSWLQFSILLLMHIARTVSTKFVVDIFLKFTALNWCTSLWVVN